jgi:L-glyceraldehyde 3-phosphate reductase
VIENVGALENLEFTSEELSEIDAHAQEGDLNLWKRPSQDERP